MLQSLSPKAVVEFLEFLEDMVLFHASKRLVLDIPIYIGGGHIRVMTTSEIYLQIQVLVLAHEVNQLRRLEEVSDSEG